MEEKEIASWQSWKNEIAVLKEKELTRKADDLYFFSDLLFRGQVCASWRLNSTLERRSAVLPTIREYGNVVKTMKVAFESLTNRRWETAFSNSEAPGPPEDYEFIVYLRHHGFPTPLLDWSRSPYIASFFAFRTKSPESAVAVFAYREYSGNGKSGSSDESSLVGCGPTIRTHPRHYHQQAEYTFCRKRVEGQWCYSSHEEVFSREVEGQDVCIKYILPACMREEALADLDSMNINAYSLFASEEGLSEMLTNRQYGYDS